jgi:hypothetical protein
LHHLFPMHIKQCQKGSSQLPVGSARLIIKPQTSAVAERNKNRTADPEVSTWNCHGPNNLS